MRDKFNHAFSFSNMDNSFLFFLFPSLPTPFSIWCLNLVVNWDSTGHHLFWKSTMMEAEWVVTCLPYVLTLALCQPSLLISFCLHVGELKIFHLIYFCSSFLGKRPIYDSRKTQLCATPSNSDTGMEEKNLISKGCCTGDKGQAFKTIFLRGVGKC